MRKDRVLVVELVHTVAAPRQNAAIICSAKRKSLHSVVGRGSRPDVFFLDSDQTNQGSAGASPHRLWLVQFRAEDFDFAWSKPQFHRFAPVADPGWIAFEAPNRSAGEFAGFPGEIDFKATAGAQTLD